MSAIYTNGIVNSAYHGGVVGFITVIYSMAARKVFKLKPADLGKNLINLPIHSSLVKQIF